MMSTVESDASVLVGLKQVQESFQETIQRRSTNVLRARLENSLESSMNAKTRAHSFYFLCRSVILTPYSRSDSRCLRIEGSDPNLTARLSLRKRSRRV
jgi:hypothetical protein